MFWFHLSSPALQCLPIISTKLQITRSVEAPGLEFPRNFECAEWFRSLTSPASEERLLSNYTALIPAAKNCLFFFFLSCFLLLPLQSTSRQRGDTLLQPLPPPEGDFCLDQMRSSDSCGLRCSPFTLCDLQHSPAHPENLGLWEG